MADTDTLAGPIFTNLTADLDLSTNTVDLTDDKFDIPDFTLPDVTGVISPLTEAELTSRKVGGTGMFDGLMEAFSAHIKEENRTGRISGREYAETYLGGMQAAMQAAVQYLLQKDQSYWNGVLAQTQAQGAQLEVVRGRLAIEQAKQELAAAEATKALQAANYALSKQKLANQEAAYDGQVLENSRLGYTISTILPKEAAKMDGEITVLGSENSRIVAQKDGILAETAQITPAKAANIAADTDVKEYQHLTLMPAQVDKLQEEILLMTYEKDFIKPATLLSITEQTEGHRAKTMDTRLDGTTPISGAIGKQKDLHSEQITSYKRDAETKVAKLMVDTWSVQRSTDENLPPPLPFSDPQIISLFANLRTNLGV